MQKLLFVLTALLSFFSISARQVSESEAAQIARNFYSSGSGTATKSAANISLAHEFKADDATLMYAFNNGSNGYVLVSGDDEIVSILGYSDNGQFDYTNLPDNARAWFEMYAQMIQTVKGRKGNSIKSYASEASVEPLMTTMWDQGWPYWNKTPQINGNQCYTGCPATAMAQIAYYHQWPVASTGSVDYVTESKKIHISAELNTTFDWANMKEIYSPYSSEESCNAVAELMREIGYAMEMDYTDQGSGCTQKEIAHAIVNNLGYDKGVRIYYASTYDSEDWSDMLKEELNAGRPILYCGYTKNEEGHAFVLDGYDNQGLFHVNWGWGGVSNGYFLVAALDPDVQGMGGANSGAGYSEGQLAIMSIQKPVEGSVAIPYTLMYEDGEMIINDTTVEIKFNELANGGYGDFEGELWCDVVSEDRMVVSQFILSEKLNIPYYQQCSCSAELPKEYFVSNIEDGTYVLRIYSIDANGVDVDVESNSDPFVIKKEGNEIIQVLDGALEVEGARFNRSSASTEQSEYIFSFDLKNVSSSTFSGDIVVSYTGAADETGLSSVETVEGETEPISITLSSGETQTIEIPSGELFNYVDYTLTVLINGEEFGDEKYEFNSGEYHAIEFRDAKVKHSNGEHVLNATIVNISAEGETYENVIFCSIYPELSSDVEAKYETEVITLAPFEAVELMIPLDTDEMEFGEYRAILSYIKDGVETRMAPQDYNAMPFVVQDVPELRADNFVIECAKTGETGTYYAISYDITNESDFYYEGEFHVKYSSNNSEGETSAINVILPPGGSVTVEHHTELIALECEQLYQFEVVEGNGVVIEGNTFEFEVPEEHALEHRNGAVVVNGDKATISAAIVNIYQCENEDESIVFTGSLLFEVYTSEDILVMEFTSGEFSLESGDYIEFELTFPVDMLPNGEYYIEIKCDEETIVYPSKAPEFHFTINNDPGSVGDIVVDDSNNIVNVVSIDGRIIKKNVKVSEATNGLAPGFYLIGNKKVIVK